LAEQDDEDGYFDVQRPARLRPAHARDRDDGNDNDDWQPAVSGPGFPKSTARVVALDEEEDPDPVDNNDAKGALAYDY
jgi:hypothetical protein